MRTFAHVLDSSNPAFYNMGGISAGLQAGAQAGAIAFVLNDQKAIDSFAQNTKFSLGADADLTLVDWSKKGAATMGSSGTGRTESGTKGKNDKMENERSRDRQGCWLRLEKKGQCLAALPLIPFHH